MPVIVPGANWGGDYSRFTGLTAEDKAYFAMLKERGKAVLDDDFNLLQEILLGLISAAAREIGGDGGVGDGFRVVGTGANNNFTISAGAFYLGGRRILLGANTTYNAQPMPGPALTTPGGARTDEVYIDAWMDEVAPTGDPDMIDPTLGVETSRRLKLFWRVRVAEGATTPPPFTDGNGIPHLTFKIATLSRTATAAINAGMVADNRPVVGSAAGIGAHNSDPNAHQDATDALRGFTRYATPAEVQTGTAANRAVTPASLVSATDALRGLIQLATNAEVQAGSNATKAVVPASLVSASDALRGLVQLATNAEVQAGSNATKAVVPASLVSATDALRGLILLATSAEVQAGVNATKAVVPASLVNASDTLRGLILLATNAEVLAGSNATKAITPAGLASLGVARLAVAQAFTARQSVTPVSVSLAGGDYACNLAQANVFDILLTGNGNVVVSSPADGQTVVLRLRQDATGGRTVNFPASFRWGAAGSPTLTPTANAVNLVTAVYFANTGTFEAVARLG